MAKTGSHRNPWRFSRAFFIYGRPRVWTGCRHLPRTVAAWQVNIRIFYDQGILKMNINNSLENADFTFLPLRYRWQPK